MTGFNSIRVKLTFMKYVANQEMMLDNQSSATGYPPGNHHNFTFVHP